jgi:hypothetical protein
MKPLIVLIALSTLGGQKIIGFLGLVVGSGPHQPAAGPPRHRHHDVADGADSGGAEWFEVGHPRGKTP